MMVFLFVTLMLVFLGGVKLYVNKMIPGIHRHTPSSAPSLGEIVVFYANVTFTVHPLGDYYVQHVKQGARCTQPSNNHRNTYFNRTDAEKKIVDRCIVRYRIVAVPSEERSGPGRREY